MLRLLLFNPTLRVPAATPHTSRQGLYLVTHICSATWHLSYTKTLFHFRTKQGSCEKETTGKNYLCSKDDGKTTSNAQTWQFQRVRSTRFQILTKPLPSHTQTPLLLQTNGQMFRDKG